MIKLEIKGYLEHLNKEANKKYNDYLAIVKITDENNIKVYTDILINSLNEMLDEFILYNLNAKKRFFMYLLFYIRGSKWEELCKFNNDLELIIDDEIKTQS